MAYINHTDLRIDILLCRLIHRLKKLAIEDEISMHRFRHGTFVVIGICLALIILVSTDSYSSTNSADRCSFDVEYEEGFWFPTTLSKQVSHFSELQNLDKDEGIGTFRCHGEKYKFKVRYIHTPKPHVTHLLPFVKPFDVKQFGNTYAYIKMHKRPLGGATVRLCENPVGPFSIRGIPSELETKSFSFICESSKFHLRIKMSEMPDQSLICYMMIAETKLKFGFVFSFFEDDFCDLSSPEKPLAGIVKLLSLLGIMKN